MLIQIQCDKFAEEFRTVDFHPGLNTVLGSIGGSNALGKSTFLWIIDYMFGGEGYCLAGSDIKQHVKDHAIRATFQFDGEYHYFVRNTSNPKSVIRCDKAGHLIQNMSLEDYRKFLGENYHPGVPFDDMISRFFRIYGKENTYEKYPYLTKPKEPDEDSVILSKTTGKQMRTTVYKKTKKQLYPALAQMKKADGFAANCEFFKLGFLDRNRVSLGMQFEEILPLLWLKSGAVGKRPELKFDEEPIMLVLPENRFAVLVEEAAFSTFAKEVAAQDSIDTVYFVTNSESAFHEMSAIIGIKNTHQLYREYIDNFVIGARRDAR